MLAHKHITKIVAAVMAAAVCLCLCAVAFSGQLTAWAGDKGIAQEYETALFDTSSILSVNIQMDEADWNDMLENAMAETYYQCNVEVNGTMFYQVGIRPKGNTSLSAIANDDTTDRYSFKLEFDHYVDGQTCFGLDKLVLSNNYADATNMKEALIYDMYRFLGADASLYNCAKISVNGEYWGVYLALEAVEDSFLLRNYGVQDGELYKPESMDMGGGGKDFGNFNAGDMDFGNMDFGKMTPPEGQGNVGQAGPPTAPGEKSDTAEPSQSGDTDSETGTESSADAGERPERNFDFGGGKGGFSMGSGGANLNYTDDDLDSYDTIWEGEVTNTKKADRQRVVAALKNIAEGTDLADSMDIDNLLRYMAVHVFSVNEDSLSGSMAHNYYLYESGGKLNLIPWDYNLALGGMGGGNDATSVVNSPIDEAFDSTDFFDTLMADETWHSEYYAYLQQLVSDYINGGGFDAFYTRVRSQIDGLVETDPTALYSYDEYLTAAETLYQVVKLRGQSIQGQLDGTIPSTEEAQRSSDALVDASALDLSVIGSMNTGGGGGPQNRPTPGESSDADGTQDDTQTAGELGGPPADFDPTQFGGPGDSAPGQSSEESADTAAGDTQQTGGNAPVGGNAGGPPGNFPGGSADSTGQTDAAENLILCGAALAVIAAALLFAVLYRRPGRRR